jgi:MraZ protein
MLYTGKYELTIDDKKRLSIPAAIRSNMDAEADGTGFYLVLGDRPGTLALFANRYFKRYAKRLANEMAPGEERTSFEKVFYSQCAELEIDRQGRVVLPEYMLEAARLGRSVCLTGSRDHLDLWNKDDYDAFITETRDQMMELQKKARQAVWQTGRERRPE